MAILVQIACYQIKIETLCLFFDDRELRDDLLHVTVSGLLVFAKDRVVKVHLLQSQKILSTLLSDLSLNILSEINDT